MAPHHRESRNALLHICYQAVRAAAAVHNPYADPATIALVGESIAEKIEGWMTTKKRQVITFTAMDADSYDYFCCILDEIHKTLPITQFFNVVLHMERLTKEQHAASTADCHHQGGTTEVDL